MPSQNVMQLLGPAPVLPAFAGGMFVPASGWFAAVVRFVPTYGVAGLARVPFGDEGAAAIAVALLNVVVWAAVFGVGAAVLYRRDSARR